MASSTTQFRALVWDLDGTLVDSVADIANAVNLVLQENNLPVLSQSDVRQMVGHGAEKLLERAYTSVDGLEYFDSADAYKRFSLHYAAHCCEQTTMYPGIAAALEKFSQLGYQQGVCTNKPHQMTMQILTHLQIDSYFTAVIGGDSTGSKKPHPEPLRQCLKQMNAHAAETLMIGDSMADVGVARAMDVAVAVFPWGYGDVPVQQLDADYYPDDVEGLVSLLA